MLIAQLHDYAIVRSDERRRANMNENLWFLHGEMRHKELLREVEVDRLFLRAKREQRAEARRRRQESRLGRHDIGWPARILRRVAFLASPGRRKRAETKTQCPRCGATIYEEPSTPIQRDFLTRESLERYPDAEVAQHAATER